MSIELYREVKRDARTIAKWIGLGFGLVFIVYLLVVAAFLLGLWH